MSKNQEIDPNAWMVTFADLVMLLLTFFVLLLTMSSMDAKKLENLMSHFKEATGVLEFAGASELAKLGRLVRKYNDTASMLVIDQNALLESIDIPDELKKVAKKTNHLLEMTDDERGLVLSFNQELLFASTEVTVNKELIPVLDAIAQAISNSDNDVLIMGNADSSPVAGGRYKTNWELSVYRGLSVLDYFLTHKELAPKRFSIGGYGASRPLYPNDTPEHRALNRRVEIIFKHM